MVVLRVVDDIRGERRRVVRTQQAPRGAVVEGQVEEGLVVIALGNLGLGAPRPDRFADPAAASSGGGALVHELAPGRHDQRRIATELVDIGELDSLALAVQMVLQEVDLAGLDRHHDRLVRCHRVPDERQGSRQEVSLVRVEEGLVFKAPLFHRKIPMPAGPLAKTRAG